MCEREGDRKIASEREKEHTGREREYVWVASCERERSTETQRE